MSVVERNLYGVSSHTTSLYRQCLLQVWNMAGVLLGSVGGKGDGRCDATTFLLLSTVDSNLKSLNPEIPNPQSLLRSLAVSIFSFLCILSLLQTRSTGSFLKGSVCSCCRVTKISNISRTQRAWSQTGFHSRPVHATSCLEV